MRAQQTWCWSTRWRNVDDLVLRRVWRRKLDLLGNRDRHRCLLHQGGLIKLIHGRRRRGSPRRRQRRRSVLLAGHVLGIRQLRGSPLPTTTTPSHRPRLSFQDRDLGLQIEDLTIGISNLKNGLRIPTVPWFGVRSPEPGCETPSHP